MEARIVKSKERKLIGLSQEMSLIDNGTFNLWKNFRGRSKEVLNRSSDDFISLQEYPIDYFKAFSPANRFVKWACVEVENLDFIPEKMDSLLVESSLFAVFNYKGTTQSAQAFFQNIYGEWIPNSDYNLDDRPHFEVLGAKYKNNDPDSEEEVWIPIKEK